MDRSLLATLALTAVGVAGIAAGVAVFLATGPERATLRPIVGMVIFGAFLVVAAWVKFLFGV